jgi:hypothetical protein
VKDIKKAQLTAIKLRGLANVVEVACGASFNLVRIFLLRRISFSFFMFDVRFGAVIKFIVLIGSTVLCFMSLFSYILSGVVLSRLVVV